jgi:hypothetical protein
MGGCSSKAKCDTTIEDQPKTEEGGRLIEEQPPKRDDGRDAAFTDSEPEPTAEMLVAKMLTLDLGTQQGLMQGFAAAKKLQDIGALDQALPVRRTLVRACAELHGETHANTLTAKNNLAGLLVTLGEKAEARELVTEVVAGYVAQFGPTHPHTLVAKENLALLTTSESAEHPIAEESDLPSLEEEEVFMDIETETDEADDETWPLEEDKSETGVWTSLNYLCAPCST